MGDNQKDLKINIVTAATGAGAQEAAGGLNKLTDATGEHTKATEKMAEASEHGEKGFAGVNLEAGESRRIINELNTAIPGLVEGLRGLTSPLGAFGLALGVFAEAKNKLDEWDKEMEEISSRLAERYGNMAEAMANANRKIAASAEEAAGALHKIEEAQRRVKEETNLAIESIHRQEQAQIALNDANEALALAKVHAAEKAGLDPVSAAAAEAQIKTDAEKRRNDIANKAAQDEILRKQNLLDNANLAEHRAQQIKDTLGPGEQHREAELDPKGGLASRQQDFEAAKKTAEEAITKQQEEVANAEQGLTAAKHTGAPNKVLDIYRSTLAEATQRLNELTADKERAEKGLESVANERAKYELEQKNYEAAKSKLTEIKGIIDSLTNELKNARSKADDDKNLRDQLLNIHSQTQSVGVLSAAIPTGLHELAKTNQSNTGNAAAAISQTLTSSNRIVADLLEVAHAQNQNSKALDAKVQQLKRDVAAVIAGSKDNYKRVLGMVGQGG